jgi:hypothetical protein
MALRITLGEVIQAVRAECGLSTNTSRGIDHLDNIRQLIRRHQTTLAEDYDWQHLEIRRESDLSRKLLQAGSRYYNFPDELNPLKISAAWVRSGHWRELNYGIDYRSHAAFDPDADIRTDPPTHWAFIGAEQFEVWPLPSTNGVANGNNEVGFTGQKKLEALLEDSNRLDLDDILVTLMVATEILAGQKRNEAAAVKGDAAMARLGRMRASLSNQARYVMGRGAVGRSSHLWPRHPTYVPR